MTTIPPRAAKQIDGPVWTGAAWMALFQIEGEQPFWVEVAGPNINEGDLE